MGARYHVYPQSMFWSKNKKNRFTPTYSNFTIYKWGLRGTHFTDMFFSDVYYHNKEHWVNYDSSRSFIHNLPAIEVETSAETHSGHLSRPPELAMLTVMRIRLKYRNQSIDKLLPLSCANQFLYPSAMNPSDLAMA